MSVPVRQTRQRAAVRFALESVGEFQTAQQLHTLLTERGDSIGLATVYRCLQALVEAGELDVLAGVDGQSRYRLCGASHHHHLVCRDCGLTVELRTDEVEQWVAKIATGQGFTDVGHSLELVGLCRDCTRKQK